MDVDAEEDDEPVVPGRVLLGSNSLQWIEAYRLTLCEKGGGRDMYSSLREKERLVFANTPRQGSRWSF